MRRCRGHYAFIAKQKKPNLKTESYKLLIMSHSGKGQSMQENIEFWLPGVGRKDNEKACRITEGIE